MEDCETYYVLEEERNTFDEFTHVEEDKATPVKNRSTNNKKSPSAIGRGMEKILQTTQNTLQTLLKTSTDDDRSKRDANTNYHDMTNTFELTTHM